MSRLASLRLIPFVVVIAATSSCDRTPAGSGPQPNPPTEAPVAITLDSDSLSFTALGDTAQIRISGRDRNGQAVSVSGAAWSITDTAIATVADGLVRARNNGTVTVTATVAGLTDSTQVTVRQEVATLTVVSGDGQQGLAGADLPLPLVVVARDRGNHPVPGAEVAWRGESGATASSNLTVSDNSGQAEVLLRLGPALGSQSASITSGTAQAHVSATALQRESNRIRRVAFDHPIANASTTTQLVSGIHAAQLESDSTGTVEINPEIPQVISLLNDSGIILSSIVFPNAPGTIRLDSHSTAVALAFLIPGIASTDIGVATRRLALIEAAAALPPLRSWIAIRRQSNPGRAIPMTDPGFSPLINALVDEVFTRILAETTSASAMSANVLIPLRNESHATAAANTSYRVLPPTSYSDASIRTVRDVAGGTEVAVTNQGGRVVVVVEAYYEGSALTVPTNRNGPAWLPKHVLLPYSTLSLVIPHGHRSMQIGVVGPAFGNANLFDQFPAKAYTYFPFVMSVLNEIVLESFSNIVGARLPKNAKSAEEFVGLLMGRSAIQSRIEKMTNGGTTDLAGLALTVLEEAVHLATENEELLLKWAVEGGGSGAALAGARLFSPVGWTVVIAFKAVALIETYASAIPVIPFTLRCDACGSTTGNGNIQGVVTCRSTAVSGATVASGLVSARTDSKGAYTLPGVAAGVQSVNVVPNPHAGCFYPVGRTVNVPGGGSVTLDLAGAPQPRISSVSPNPAPARQDRQPLAINGSAFMSGAQVVLRQGAQGFTIPADRTQVEPNRIVVTAGLGSESSTWTAEVLNPGGISSGRFTFQVVAPTVPPVARITVTGAGETVQEGAEVTLRVPHGTVVDLALDGTRSIAGSGVIRSFEWLVGGGLARSGSQANLGVGGGRHEITLRVTNTAGAAHTAAAVVNVIEEQTACTNVAGFVSKSPSDNTALTPGQGFTMQWTVRNTGTCTWNSGYTLRYGSRTNQQISLSQTNVPVSGAIAPGQSYSFSVPMRAPTAAGTHREDWGLFSGTGQKFHDAWAQIVVSGAVTSGTLMVRPTLNGATYTAVNGASYRAQLFSGSTLLQEVSASGTDFNFGTRPFASYRVDVYQGGILIGQQTTSFSSSSPNPIPVPLFPKRELRVTAYYSNGTTPLPAGYTVRVRDLSPATVASGTTNGSGQATEQVFPTHASGGNGYTVQVLTSGGTQVGSRASVQVANSSTASLTTVTTSVTVPVETNGTLVVRPTLNGTAYTAASGASYKAQLFSGSTLLQEVSASGTDFNFGTRPFASYRIDIYQGGILIGQQTTSFGASSPSPIPVALFPKRDLRMTAYYSNGTTPLPAGYTVRIRDLSPATVASGTTNGSGQATEQVFPTHVSGGNGYTVQVLTSGGTQVGSRASVQVANSSAASLTTVTTSVTVPVETSGTLVVRPTLNGTAYTAASGASYKAQLFSGSTLLQEVSASGTDFNFGTRPFASYRIDVYQGGILIGQQTTSFGASSPSPIPVPLFPKRELRVTAYYSNGTTPLPAGYTVRVRDLSPATVASGTTNGSGQATEQVFPTHASGGNGYTVQVLASGGTQVGSRASVQVANSSTASLTTVTTSVTVPVAVGSIRSTLRNIDGSSAAASGTRHLLYTSPARTLAGSNPITFTSVPVGNYLLEGYSTGTFFGEEFWTSQSNVTVVAGQTVNVTLTRNYPYASVVIKNDATGAVLAAGQSVPAGTRLRAEVTVRNNVPGTTLSSRVRFLFDRSKTTSYDFDQTAPSQTVSGSGGTRLYTFIFTPTSAGQYHYALGVTTAVNGSYILTDSWTWTPTITRQ